VLVETALVAGIILTFLLFGIQTGILGFLQITADAASFVAARTDTLSTADPRVYTAAQFSQLRPGDVATAVPIPAPTSTVPVDYGYNGATADPNYYQFHRTGGYSQLQPILRQVTVTPSKVFKVGGVTPVIRGSDTEPEWTECGAHFNLAGSTAQCGGVAPTNYQTDYFANGENTPPYYVGFNQMQVCNQNLPWGYFDGLCPPGGGSSSTGFAGLGVAERLEVSNWSRATAGAINATDLFSEAGCHQRYYAQLADFYEAYTTLRYLYDKNQSSMHAMLFDSGLATRYPYTNWSGYSDPAHPANLAIRTVYGWDQPVVPSAPLGTDQATPGLGC